MIIATCRKLKGYNVNQGGICIRSGSENKIIRFDLAVLSVELRRVLRHLAVADSFQVGHPCRSEDPARARRSPGCKVSRVEHSQLEQGAQNDSDDEYAPPIGHQVFHRRLRFLMKLFPKELLHRNVGFWMKPFFKKFPEDFPHQIVLSISGKQ